jgi:tRNA nucleotidyltransferase/poly(A) polymerase
MLKSFSSYFALREAQENGESKGGSKSKDSVGTKISMGDGNNFQPFFISNDPKSEHHGKNKNLAPIVKAFKEGANWGWTRDPKTGEDKPVKITGKKLYMVGGSVRDHLMGKTPKNIDLATDASPDEIYRLLTQNGFKFITPDGDTKNNNVKEASEKGNKDNTFSIKTKDTKGRPFQFEIKVKDDTYTLSLFTKNSKGGEMAPVRDAEPGTMQDDASSRDFTMNAMAIALTNDNGPNKELVDFFGGIHHLTNGKVLAVGDLKSKINEDPLRAMRFVRMASRYGKPDQISQSYKDTIKGSANLLREPDDTGAPRVSKDRIRDEFMKGLDYDDANPRQYLGLHRDMGLLDSIFPNMKLNTNMPKALSELGDKYMPIAWLLKNELPENIEKSLSSDNWDKNDLKKITFLIKALNLNGENDPDTLDDLLNSFMSSGFTSRKLKDWLTKLGGKDENLVSGFLQYLNSPRVKATEGDQVKEEFKDIIDPISLKPTQYTINEVAARRKLLEHKMFKAILREKGL